MERQSTPPWFGLLLVLTVLLMVSPASAEWKKRQVEDVAFEVIETGYEPMSCCDLGPKVNVVGNWLSDDVIAFNALREVSDANNKQLQRAIVFDVRTRKSRVIVEEGSIQCWNPERQIASINHAAPTGERRLMRLDTEGNLGEPSGPPDLDDFFCRPINAEERLTGITGFQSDGLWFRDSDGYIPYIPPGKKRNRDTDKAVWVRPGKPPLALPILRKEITGGRAIYLAYSGQYLLNEFDSQGSSDTDRRLAGRTWGDRPYDLTPYRLLSRDGSIAEIPYPYVLQDYGIRSFDKLIPTRVGYLFGAVLDRHFSLFLLQEDRVIRFWGKPVRFKDGDSISGLTLSPDGCKIVFRRARDWLPATRKHVTIINMCKGA